MKVFMVDEDIRYETRDVLGIFANEIDARYYARTYAQNHRYEEWDVWSTDKTNLVLQSKDVSITVTEWEVQGE